jgi:hypothetical protein
VKTEDGLFRRNIPNLTGLALDCGVTATWAKNLDQQGFLQAAKSDVHILADA